MTARYFAAMFGHDREISRVHPISLLTADLRRFATCPRRPDRNESHRLPPSHSRDHGGGVCNWIPRFSKGSVVDPEVTARYLAVISGSPAAPCGEPPAT
jgi:hypothetical protein